MNAIEILGIPSITKEVREDWCEDIHKFPSQEGTREGIDWLYSLAGLQAPKGIFIVDSAREAQEWADSFFLRGEKNAEGDIYTAFLAKVYWPVREQVSGKVHAQIVDETERLVDMYRTHWEWAQAQDKLQADLGELYVSTLGLGLGGASRWATVYEVFQRDGIVKHEGFNCFIDLLSQGVWDLICLGEWCIVVAPPSTVSYVRGWTDTFGIL